MTIYGENDYEFRRGAGKARTSLVSIAAALIAAVLATLVVGLSAMAGALLMQEQPEGVILSAPLAADALRPLAVPPLAPDDAALVRLGGVAVAGAIALLFIFFWPGRQLLATRLVSLAFALQIAVVGLIAPALDPSHFELLRDFIPIPELAIALVAGLFGIWLVLLAERQTLSLLTNIHVLVLPGRRLLLWLLRIPLPFLLLAALAWVNGFRAGAIAWVAALLVTFAENVAREPKERFERLEEWTLKEAAIAMPLLAVVLLAASLFLFGAEGAGLPQRAIVVTGERPRMVEVERMPEWTPPAREDDEEQRPKIEIRWSREREQEAQQQPPPAP